MTKRIRMTPSRRRSERRLWKKLVRDGRKALLAGDGKRVQTTQAAPPVEGAVVKR
jgi:hypothetical protein